ncbi:MAG: flagellar brake protein [Nitrospiraceae bacterium]|nr:flagellar brake protein [Nitrospiraceae bacterium]
MKDVVASPPPSASFLTVGHPLKISLCLFGEKAAYGSTLLGWKEHAWLICEWPGQWAHGPEIPKDTPCTVSYLHEGRLVGYHSVIRDMARLPLPVLFLAFPDTVEQMQLRKHPRVTSCEPAMLIRSAGGARATAVLSSSSDYTGGIIKDLSLGGCSIAIRTSPSWLRPGSAIRMEFELPGLGHVTNLSGIVRNAAGRDGDQLVGVAFEFGRMEYIEYRGWGGTVEQAITQWTMQRDSP